jgi:hypothetical protein
MALCYRGREGGSQAGVLVEYDGASHEVQVFAYDVQAKAGALAR